MCGEAVCAAAEAEAKGELLLDPVPRDAEGACEAD